MGPRTGSFLFAFLAFALLALGLTTPASATPPAREGEVLIKFKASASAATIDAIRADLGVSSIRRFERIRTEHDRLMVRTVEDAIGRYRNHPAIEFIEPNYIVSAVRTPDDPRFSEMWGLRNTGQSGGVPGADIDATAAWEVTTGSDDVVVAIIDTGTDYTHPDLAANIYANPGETAGNAIDDDGNGFIDDVRGWDFVNHDNDPMDDEGHGTHVAGTIGAVGNNGIGVVGVAWTVRLMPLKFLGSDGFGSTADAIACIEYATMMGVDVMSNSWGGGGFSEALRQAIQDANIAGILFVAAAGNAANNNDTFPFYPAGYNVPNVISVAATDRSDNLANFSNFGATTVHLAAPGQDILSTMRFANYGLLSGTSMATPHVSGALALVRSRFPGISASAAKALLLNSVDPLPSLSGRVVSGGRLNAVRSLEGPDSLPPDPVTDLVAEGTGSNRVTLTWTARGDDGTTGTASNYDIRYALSPITEATFANSNRFPYLAPPLPAGAQETVHVTGLVASSTYFFAVKVLDEYGNASGISNSANGTTLEPPDVQVTPLSLDADLLTGGQTTRTLTLSNPTGGTLDFSVDVNYGAGPGGPPAPPDSLGARPAVVWSEVAASYDPATAPPPIGSVGAAVFLPDVVNDPVGDGGQVDLTVLRARSGADQLEVEMELSTTINPLNFGGALSLDIDQDNSTGYPPVFGNPLQDIGAEYDLYFFNLGSNVVLLYTAGGSFVGSLPVEIGAHTLRFTVPLALIGNDDGAIDVSGVIGTSFGPTDWFPDSGHGTIQGFQWLSVVPATGVVPPGGSVDVTVTFDAAGLFGGGYDASVQIASNDPDEPLVAVPAHMDVTGAPDIVLSAPAVDFGDVFLTASRSDSIVVTNAGTDQLDITELAPSTPDFEVGVGPFSLQPGERRTVPITFRPSIASAITGSLRIRSNDSDESEVFVALSGTGLVPPEIEVSPGSFQASLLTGQAETQTLHITNTGASNLTLQLDTRREVVANGNGPAPAGNPGQHSQTADDNAVEAQPRAADAPVPVLVIQDTAAWGVNMGAFLQARFGITPTVIHASQIATTDFGPYDLIITVGDEASSYYNALSTNVAKFDAFVSNGGVVQYQLATQGSNVTIAGGALVQFGSPEDTNRNVLPEHPILAGLPELLQGNFANHGILTQLPPSAQILTRTQNSNQPTTVEYRLGAGTVIATGMTWEFLYNGGYNSGPMLYQATAYSLSQAQPQWLAVSPSTATLPPGGSLDVTVSFSAVGLFGGPYDGSVRVISNDPDESQLLIPAHLDVTGAPDISLSATALDFGGVFLTASLTDSIVVTNAGTDQLDITELGSSTPDFEVGAGPFSLDPGERRTVPVTFRPSVASAVTGSLRIQSNDADEGEVFVALSGTGLVPPDVGVNPTSLAASVLTGETAERTLTVSNTGGSDLVFEVRPARITDTPGSGTPVPVPEALQSPTRNSTQPTPPSPQAQGEYQGAHIRFGLTAYGEVLPFQSPVGNEHLAVGSYLSGYTVAYMVGGQDRLAYASYDSRVNLVPVSYQELENTPTRVVVLVVARTEDAALRIQRRITFQRNEKFVRVETTLENPGAAPLTNVVLKEYADWDVDADYEDDSWDYDRDRNMVVAWDQQYVAIAAAETPTLMDLYGWNDYYTRPTFVDFPSGPVHTFDGLELLHFELGDLAGAQTRTVLTAFGTGSTLAELQSVMDRAVPNISWLSVDPEGGTVPAGATAEVRVRFDPGTLRTENYEARLALTSNDPDESEVTVPVSMHVTGVPLIGVDPVAFEFGSLFVGQSATRLLTVQNLGTETLVVGSIASDEPSFSPAPSSFSVPPFGSQTLLVTCAPLSPGDHSGTLAISHNAAGSPTVVPLHAVALMPPVVAVSPASIHVDAYTNDVRVETLTIGNVGASDLVFTLEAGSQPAAIQTSSDPLPAKGEADTRVGDPVTAGMGGPDNFGYRWIDSDQPGGPAFSWVDIEPVGTSIPISGDDQISGTIPMSFPFSFYGVDHSSFRVTTNGYLTFTGNSAPYSNAPFPTLNGQPNMVAAYWDDLYFDPNSRAHYLDDGTRMVVQFSRVLHLSGGGPYTFQIILYRSGAVLCQYLSMGNPRNSASIGIQNGAMNDGLTVVFNNNYVHDQLAIRIAAAPAWLSLAPLSGTVPAGGSIPIQATLDATGLFGGSYPGLIRIQSNDPVTPQRDVPVTLQVTGVPDMALSPTTLDFGTIYVGETRSQTLHVTNIGSDRLDVTGFAAGHPDYSVVPASFALDPLQSRTVSVTYAPTTPGSANSSLSLASNDPTPPAPVSLIAVALVPPEIEVSPGSFQASLYSGQTESQTLHITNTGASNLTLQLDTRREVVANGNGPDPAGTPGQLQSQTSDDSAVESQIGAADAPVRVLVIQDTDAWGISMAAFLQARFGIAPTVIHANQIGATNFGPYDLIITVGDEASSYYNALSTNVAKFESYVASGGVIQYQLATHGSNVAIAGGALVRYGNLENFNRNILPGHPVMAGLPELLPGNWANHCTLAQLPPNAQILTRTENSNLPTTAEYRVGAGTVIATGMTCEYLYNFGYPSGPMLYQATAYSLSKALPPWLSVSPSTAILSPGEGIDLTVTFDSADLTPGDYQGSVRVTSNDPDEGLLLLPASLHVIGVPFLSVRPASLDFDTLYVGENEVRTIQVINSGTERLDVSSITAGLPGYTAIPATFSLDPAESVAVTVSLLGGTVGPRNTDLTILSNSPLSPDLVPMRAVVLVPPRIVVTPLLVEAAAPPGGRAHRTVSICNEGGSDLRFQIAGPGIHEPEAMSYLEVAKGDRDPREGIEGAGGPDNFGYTWIDSESPSGPVYDWIDITTTGTRVPFSPGADDENRGPYPIGFAFSYYGRVFSQFRVCTNGWISFTNSSSSFAYQPLPNEGPDVPENLIAPAWGDYYLAPGSAIYYKAEPSRLVVQFHDIVPVGDFSPYPIDFEVILYPGGRIVYQYRTVALPVPGMMIGQQNEARDDGITIAFNSSHYLRPNRAIEIVGPAPGWIVAGPLAGVVPSGACTQIAFDMDASDLEPGNYSTSLRITSNDPASPVLSSSVELHVGEVEATSVDFDPNTLNLDSNGRFVMCFVELPPELDPSRVVLSTVRFQGTIPTSQNSLRIGDYNQNSIPDLQFLFDRTAVENLLPEGPEVQVAVTGEVGNTTCFVARDVIRAIRPLVLAPNGGEILLAGSATTIRWENPNGWNPDYAAVYCSANQESTWIPVDEHVEGESVAWTVPGVPGSLVRARVRVYLFDEEGVMGYDSSDSPFVITNSITGVEVAETTLPTRYELNQNAPNPFNPVTTIHYALPASAAAKLEIFRVDGGLVRTLVDRALPAGRHQAVWDGRDDHGRQVASGMYVYRFRAGSFTESRRMILMK